MNQVENQENFNLSIGKVALTSFSAYCYSTWLSLVLAKWLPFAKAENVYFAVFVSLIFFIFYVIFTSAIISKLCFWAVNTLGVILLLSYWLWVK
jgi:hypothetical protein